MGCQSLLCYAEGQVGEWEAFCLDLDLAVQGETFDEVYHGLHEAILLYVESVADLPEPERRRLLRRRAPLILRLRFFCAAICSVIGRKPAKKERAGFTATCPEFA